MPDTSQQRTIYIDDDPHGFGDACLAAWISEGSRNAPTRLVHRATGQKAALLRMLGQEVDESIDPAACCTTFDAYFRYELTRERGSVPRVLSRGRSIGIDVERFPPQRPSYSIPAEAIEWADRQIADLLASSKRSRFVYLFPQVCYGNREWPGAYWNDLAWAIRKADDLDAATIVNLAEEDKRYKQVPIYMFGQSWERIAALMVHPACALVVGNDSGPVNLAGTLDVRTLCLLGPSKPTIFAHMPSVVSLAIDPAELACVGCHWGEPFRAACDSGCQALMRLYPEKALEHVAELLRCTRHRKAAS